VTGFLLDTNVVSELRKRDRANEGVLHWFGDRSHIELWLSVLVIGELRRGVESIRRRDPAAGQLIGTWLDSVTTDYADRILPVTQVVAERWGALSVPDPMPVVDGLLAATAIEHDLTLVTRNVSDVARTEVKVVNPFTND
jgi:toxin FitB